MNLDVTRINFEDILPEITARLKKADFVAIDAEFSGIYSDSPLKNSLFDSAADRYASARDNIKHYTIIQLGITAFQFKREENKYIGSSYVFHVSNLGSNIPLSLCGSEKNDHFETSAAEFLSLHSFKFNKLVYEGVGYLNNREETKLWEDLENVRNSELVLSQEMQTLIEKKFTSVTEWLESAECGSKFLLFDKIDYRKKFEVYFLIKKIQEHFPALGIFKNSTGKVYLEVLQPSREDKKVFIDDDEFVEECLGVTKVFRLLTKLKKPIVGHNPLLDLMFMYKQFHEPLPTKYKQFKKNIHSLFPQIYDTKYLSYELRESLNRDVKWENNGLQQLYDYFKTGHGFHLARFSPSIKLELSETIISKKNKFHEAGWDSFCTGYCFIRIMHFFAIQKILDSMYEPKPLVSQQHLHAVKPHVNRVNIARAQVNHMCFDGPDPPSKRPNHLLVTMFDGQPVNTTLLALHLNTLQGAIEMKPLSQYKVLLAATSLFNISEVMCKLDEFVEWKVVQLKTETLDTMILPLAWTILTSSLSAGAFLLYRGMSK